MYIYIYVCVDVYIHIYYMYIRMQAYINMLDINYYFLFNAYFIQYIKIFYIYMYMHIGACLQHMHACVARMHACTHARMLFVSVFACMHASTPVSMHACMQGGKETNAFSV